MGLVLSAALRGERVKQRAATALADQRGDVLLAVQAEGAGAEVMRWSTFVDQGSLPVRASTVWVRLQMPVK